MPPLYPAEVAADRIVRILREAGFPAFRVGGCVRDRLLGRGVNEVDVATGAPPAAVRSVFPRTFAVGEAFGVVIVHTPSGVDVEVATFRKESGYADGRHPANVEVSDVATDARRRDFTVNALFYDPVAETIFDSVGGRSDLRRGVLRAIGAPDERFAEDYLRMLRAVRFAASLGFALEPATRRAMPPLAGHLSAISAERVRDEITRMLTGTNPASAVRLLGDLGLLRVWLPELDAMRDVPQPPEYHPEGDVWEHTLLCLEHMRAPSPELAWSVLLHDAGKPPTLKFKENRVPTFPGHARESAGVSDRILRRLRASGKLRKAVHAAAANHMTFRDVRDMRTPKLRRFMARETFNMELELHRIDCAASHGGSDNYVFLLDKSAQFADEPVLPAPLLNGRDVMQEGVAEGPAIGRILKKAREMQLDGELRTRGQALEWLHSEVEELTL